MRFIGLDLAWSMRNNSAAAVLEMCNYKGATLVSYKERLKSNEEILDYIAAITPKPKAACIAIDAPLIVRNETGARPVDREITRLFGRYGAGAHPCNRRKFPQGVRGEKLVKELCRTRYGYEHRPFIHHSNRRRPMRTIIEVYPHPAQVVLFGLKKRILYKKGCVESRRMGLKTLQAKIGAHLLVPQTGRPIRLHKPVPYIKRNALIKDLLSRDVRTLKGTELKSYEDTLDALICAYIGLYHWYWGDERSQVIGDMRDGYIVLPSSVPFFSIMNPAESYAPKALTIPHLPALTGRQMPLREH